MSKSVYHGSNVLFPGVLSNHVVTATVDASASVSASGVDIDGEVKSCEDMLLAEEKDDTPALPVPPNEEDMAKVSY